MSDRDDLADAIAAEDKRHAAEQTVIFHWSANSVRDAAEEEDSDIPVDVWAHMPDSAKVAILLAWVHERISMWADPA